MFKLCFALFLWLGPVVLAFRAWKYWFLRPLVFYTVIMPWLPEYLILLITLPKLLWLTESMRARIHAAVESLLLDYVVPAYARIMHGYEITGLENIPPGNEGGLIVLYHGVVPNDGLFAYAAVRCYCGRKVRAVIHRLILSTPIIGTLAKDFGFVSESREELISVLKNGNLVAVAPGGMYETMFSENYSVEFRGRYGFAAAAKAANVPIIPMFTENVREYQQVHFFGLREMFKWLHETYKLQFIWSFGGWPVKLRTHLGERMYSEETETAQEFALRVEEAIEDLRDKHQNKDGSIIRALLERLPKKDVN